ncbi:MAG TPA: response regulator transcription factor [Rhodocyclaceae bacterium]|nr:response regulator transcription factor [Rhodocyclaceae bacterium]
MENKLKVFVVDDESSTRMIIRFHLEDDFQVMDFSNAQACLTAIKDEPDILLLDVEMPEMNGIDLCQAVRAAGHARPHVIFISAHDDLETRLKAYSVGGNDYLVKPFAPEELMAKLRVAQQVLKELGAQRQLAHQASNAQQTAFAAMSSMGEMGVALAFLRSSFACDSVERLADGFFTALRSLELTGLLELRTAEKSCCFSSHGECSPLESSILGHARSMERLFQFRDRVAINFPNLTVIVSVPMNDADRAGRLRDQLMVIAEGAEMRLGILAVELGRLTHARRLTEAADELKHILADINQHHQMQRVELLAIFHDQRRDIEWSFSHMHLNEQQESALSTIVERAAARVGDMLGATAKEGARLQTVATRLLKEAAQ